MTPDQVVRTIDEYLDAIRSAWKDEENTHVHAELVNSTLDYKAWLEPHV